MEQTKEWLKEQLTDSFSDSSHSEIIDELIELSIANIAQEKCIKDLETANMVLKHRLVDDFFEEGFLANQDGCDLVNCPYDEGTDGEFGWKNGWREAQKEQDNLS